MPSTPRLFALGLAWCLATPALAGPHRDAVMHELNGIEDPPSAASLKAIAPDVHTELIEILGDASARHSARARAVHALGWFPNTTTRPVVEAALKGDDRLLARKAAYALANGWGVAALPQLTDALAASDAQLREAAAHALGNIDDKAVVPVLDARLAVEDSAAVRETIEGALARRR